MTEKKAPAKRKAARRKANLDRVAVMTTTVGELLVLGSDPTEDEVRGFVAEQNRRFWAGEPGGPGGSEPVLVTSARYFEENLPVAQHDLEKGEPIDLGEALNSGRPAA